MSAIENPNLQAVPDPGRQLPPADLSLSTAATSVADWLGRTQTRVKQFSTGVYRATRDGSVSVAQSVRDRSLKIKEENPVALLAGIAGTAFALGVAARVWRSKG